MSSGLKKNKKTEYQNKRQLSFSSQVCGHGDESKSKSTAARTWGNTVELSRSYQSIFAAMVGFPYTWGREVGLGTQRQ